jgi:hypothetical protein
LNQMLAVRHDANTENIQSLHTHLVLRLYNYTVISISKKYKNLENNYVIENYFKNDHQMCEQIFPNLIRSKKHKDRTYIK